jgi:hypothetical protein
VSLWQCPVHGLSGPMPCCAQSSFASLHPTETNRDKALRGEAVHVSDRRLQEMRDQAIRHEGVTADPVYHWHWAAIVNELMIRRAADTGEKHGGG